VSDSVVVAEGGWQLNSLDYSGVLRAHVLQRGPAPAPSPDTDPQPTPYSLAPWIEPVDSDTTTSPPAHRPQLGETQQSVTAITSLKRWRARLSQLPTAPLPPLLPYSPDADSAATLDVAGLFAWPGMQTEREEAVRARQLPVFRAAFVVERGPVGSSVPMAGAQVVSSAVTAP
jgi:hypothetical protein